MPEEEVRAAIASHDQGRIKDFRKIMQHAKEMALITDDVASERSDSFTWLKSSSNRDKHQWDAALNYPISNREHSWLCDVNRTLGPCTEP